MDDFRPLENLSFVFDCVADGVIAIDLEGRLTFFNPAAEVITKHSGKEALGRYCAEIFCSVECGHCCPREESLITAKPIMNRLHKVSTADGREIDISLSVAPILDDGNELQGWVHSFRPIDSQPPSPAPLQRTDIFEGIISRNAEMKKLFATLPDLASSESTILVRGDSGTGKELFAKALHNLSPRKDGPMVTVNCGALPEHLLESEIFGVRRGAYTGAGESRPGRLEQAEKGTLFLDEIGDMPLPLQVKLLRILENREYQPLGASHMLKADVRFVAATNKDLESLVEQGLFRRDLFYRLCVLSIELPPLRERREDIPLLGKFFLSQLNKRFHKKIEGMSPQCCALMYDYPFPGNIRELKNIIEHSVIMCNGKQIELQHLPEDFRKKTAGTEKQGRKRPDIDEILQILTKHNGNKTEVAQELGVDRTTLWRWLKKANM